MKYSEFREYLALNKIPFQEDEEKIKVTYHVEISKIEERRIMFITNVINFPYEFEMLKRIIELAETPLDEREEEKKYYLKHRYINNWGDDTYLNYVEGNYIILTDKCQNPNYKTKFTKAEIEEFKEKFDTDFNDFELIEVED